MAVFLVLVIATPLFGGSLAHGRRRRLSADCFFACPTAARALQDGHLQTARRYPAWRQRSRFIAFIVRTVSPRWLSTAISVRTMPRSGFDRERRASVTVTRIRSVSPGRTGLIQRSSSMPGEARLGAPDR